MPGVPARLYGPIWTGEGARRSIVSVLDSLDFQSRERSSIDMYVHGQEPIIVRGGVGSDQEVRESATSAQVAMLAAAFRVASERSASRSPDRFLKFPIDYDSGVCKERADEIFGAPRGGDQFGEDRGGHDEISALESGFKRGASGRGHPWALVPQSDKDVRVDGGCHCRQI